MGKKPYKIGYTAGVYDLFHKGHARVLKRAKAMCDCLIVGVSTDELVFQSKNKKPIIPFDQRVEVVEACRYADVVVAQKTLDKVDAWDRFKFDLLVVGDDWFGRPEWKKYEEELNRRGVTIIFVPRTEDISSTLIDQILKQERDKQEKSGQ